MKHTLLAGVAVLVITACTSDGATVVTTAPPPTTVATAAPTTTPPTATQPTTTAPRTTTNAPTTPVTAAPDGRPAEVAVAEVTARLDAFWAEMDRCFEGPADCDADVVIAEYADPSTPVAAWFAGWADEFTQSGERMIMTDQIRRELAAVENTEDGDTVLTEQCITDNSALVKDGANGTVVTDDETGYQRMTMVWRRSETRWTVVGSTVTPLDRTGDVVCSFE